jgi:hypothetical protein
MWLTTRSQLLSVTTSTVRAAENPFIAVSNRDDPAVVAFDQVARPIAWKYIEKFFTKVSPHMQAMQDNMTAMSGMGGGQAGGMARGDGKPMAGGDMMQMMMEQMLQHQQAMESLPAK